MDSVSSFHTQWWMSYSCIDFSSCLSLYPVMRRLVWFSVLVIENKTERSYGGMVYCITCSNHRQSMKEVRAGTPAGEESGRTEEESSLTCFQSQFSFFSYIAKDWASAVRNLNLLYKLRLKVKQGWIIWA